MIPQTRDMPHPGVRELLSDFRARLRGTLGNDLAGLYLTGSLVTGDFDPGCSDVDLIAVTLSEMDDERHQALDCLHDSLARRHPEWAGRVEAIYVSTNALQSFRVRESVIAVISPGEPFHRLTAGTDWLMNWYVARRFGAALFGPPPETWIAPIEWSEYMAALRDGVDEAGERAGRITSRPGRAYTILTVCRALYAAHLSEQASKTEAARWAAGAFPKWANLITKAMSWRAEWRESAADPSAGQDETHRFIQFARENLAASVLASR